MNLLKPFGLISSHSLKSKNFDELKCVDMKKANLNNAFRYTSISILLIATVQMSHGYFEKAQYHTKRFSMQDTKPLEIFWVFLLVSEYLQSSLLSLRVYGNLKIAVETKAVLCCVWRLKGEESTKRRRARRSGIQGILLSNNNPIGIFQSRQCQRERGRFMWDTSTISMHRSQSINKKWPPGLSLHTK